MPTSIYLNNVRMIMLQHKRKFRFAFGISVLASIITACAGPETTSTLNEPASPPVADSTISTPQATESVTKVSVPGVNVEEINFKPAPEKSSIGHFDAVNGSSAPKIEVPKVSLLTATGWAISSEAGKLPDNIIITHGDNNSLVAVAPVNVERLDVEKALKNPAYKNSGWSATFDSSTLPDQEVVLKAWAYNSATKEATQLNSTYEVVVLN